MVFSEALSFLEQAHGRRLTLQTAVSRNKLLVSHF